MQLPELYCNAWLVFPESLDLFLDPSRIVFDPIDPVKDLRDTGSATLVLDRMYFAPPASETIPIILGGIGACGRLTFTLVYLENAEKDQPSVGEDMVKIKNRALEYIGFPEKAKDMAI